MVGQTPIFDRAPDVGRNAPAGATESLGQRSNKAMIRKGRALGVPTGRAFMRAEETRVLSKGSNQTRDVGIGTVDEATLCEDQADYDGPGSRMVIAHVLRPHLEPQCLTASEVLYGTKQLRQILDQNAVVDAALSRIAQIQSRLPGQDLKARRAALQAAGSHCHPSAD